MKKLTFTFALALIGFLGYSQQASQLIPTQGNNPKPTTPPNYLYVDVSTNRIWPVLADSIRLKSINIQWLNDSVIVIGDRRWVKLSGTYPNPSFIASLSSSKVTGLSTVATSGDYNDLSNKPNLSVYETTSHANSTFYPISNPNGFISSYAETDPVWSGVSANYRTKVQNDGLYYPLTGNPSNFLTTFVEVDPTVPSYSKSLTAFSVIKSSTDPLYRPITYTPSSADIISGLGFTPYNSTNPSGFLTGITSGQVTTALGYTPVTNARTLTINGTAFDLSANRSWTVGDVTSASLSSTLSSYVLTSTYTAGLAAKQNALSLTTTGSGAATLVGSTLNIPTPTPTVYTAGTGISIASNVITNTAPDYIPTAVASTRTLNSNFTISTTKQSLVNYSISLSVTNPLLVGSSTAAAYLEYSVNAGSTWIPVSDGLVSSSVGVTVTVAITNTQTQILSGTIPANALVRIRTTTTGTASVVYVRGQETY